MVVRAAGHQFYAPFRQAFRQRLCISDDLRLIRFKFGLQRFLEADCLSGDHMFQRTSLYSRKYGLIKIKFLGRLLICQDHAASRPPKCLMGRCGHHIRIGDRAWVKPCRHQTGNVSHIHHQIGSHLICDLPELFKINDPRIRTGSCYDQLWLFSFCNLTDHVIIDHALIVHSVKRSFKIRSGNINRRSVSQMSAMVQIHPQDLIPGL